jgi:hypothetical protein
MDYQKVPHPDDEASVQLLHYAHAQKEKHPISPLIKAAIAGLSLLNLMLLLTLASFIKTYDKCRLDQMNTVYCKFYAHGSITDPKKHKHTS